MNASSVLCSPSQVTRDYEWQHLGVQPTVTMVHVNLKPPWYMQSGDWAGPAASDVRVDGKVNQTVEAIFSKGNTSVGAP